MERKKIRGIASYIMFIVIFVLVAEGCHSSKKCGCEGDLMGKYKVHRKRNY